MFIFKPAQWNLNNIKKLKLFNNNLFVSSFWAKIVCHCSMYAQCVYCLRFIQLNASTWEWPKSLSVSQWKANFLEKKVVPRDLTG